MAARPFLYIILAITYLFDGMLLYCSSTNEDNDFIYNPMDHWVSISYYGGINAAGISSLYK